MSTITVVVAMAVGTLLVACGTQNPGNGRATIPVSGRPHSATPTLTAATPTALPPRPLTVLLFGDSVMKGYGAPAGSAWPNLVAQNFGWSADNLACDGAGFIRRAPRDCGENIPAVISTQTGANPDIVMIEGSANDFGTNNDALADTTNRTFLTLRSMFPNARILGLRVAWGDQVPPGKVAIINSQIAYATASVNGTFIDFGTPLRGHPEWMQPDHLHPNATGQRILAEAIEAAVTAAGIVTQTPSAAESPHV